LGDEATATEFARGLMELYLKTPVSCSSPSVAPGTSELFQRLYGLEPDRYRKEKEESNRFVMARFEEIRRRAREAEDPVYAGLQLAILGNYIDFSALQGEVSFEKLDEMLEKASQIELDLEVYQQFCQELTNGKTLLYLTDNAGEIGFDRVFAEEIHRAYPHLDITFCVRGGYAMNDATRADAQLVGIPFPIIDNGNSIPGTEIDQLSEAAKTAMDTADVILSKGQGNAETLLGTGYNIYYAFLIKCPRFIDRYQKPKLTPMFVKERGAL
jgi:uncharacterized protein with ATP-grasp and redox domains